MTHRNRIGSVGAWVALATALTGGAAAARSEMSAAPDAALADAAPALSAKGKYLVYAGTYTNKGGKGIYVFPFDTATGKAGEPTLAAAVTSPSFLSLHPDGKHLYSISETSGFGGTKGGAVSGFAIDRGSGKLTLLNEQSSVGAGPCFITVDRAGKNVLVANYGGGSVACLPIGPDFKLGEATSFIQHEGSSVNPRRQEAPHAHSINVSPDNRFAYAADLGLDKVLIYRFDAATGKLTASTPDAGLVAAGSGPRHFAFHPNGKTAYVINEMTSTLTAFKFDPQSGALTELQTLPTLPSPQPSSSTAEVVVHPSGKWIYGSNRGHDSIAIYAVDADGKLTAKGHQPTGGKTPRNFNIDPSGKFLLAANQDSDTVTVFSIDQATGALTATGQSLHISMPVCLKFLPVD